MSDSNAVVRGAFSFVAALVLSLEAAELVMVNRCSFLLGRKGWGGGLGRLSRAFVFVVVVSLALWWLADIALFTLQAQAVAFVALPLGFGIRCQWVGCLCPPGFSALWSTSAL